MVSIAELMITCMAREIADGNMVLQGLYSPMPMIACLLAKNFHAPNMVYFNTADTIDPEPDFVPFSTAGPKLEERAVAYIPLSDVFDLAQRKKIDLIFLGAAQIDRYGNTNLSVIGDYKKPKVRLPGGAATAHLCAIIPTIIWIPNHNRRVFVEKLDFITGQGYLKGEQARKIKRLDGGPRKVITNLCVLDFDEETKKMRIESIHPGVELKEVIENTGFNLMIPENLKVTKLPTEKEVRFIEKIDPHKVRNIEFLKR